VRPLLSDNPLFEVFGQRALTQAVFGGSDFGECVTTIERVGEGTVDDWHREWVATANRVESIGDDAAAGGHAVSAREAFLRAATYYRTAYFPLFGAPVDPRLVSAFQQETAAFRKACPLFEPPIEPLEIPFGGASLPGYFVRAGPDDRPRPTIVHVNGYDSNIQEVYFAHAPAATPRGYHCLLVDGPGQGRNLIRDGIHIRPDWEQVVGAVIDHAMTLPRVERDRLVLAGWSFGGFLAPRAAAFESRIAALIADPGQWDQRDAILATLPLTDDEKARFPDIDRERLAPMEEWLRGPDADPLVRWRVVQRGLWVHGKDTVFDYFADLCGYELSPVAHRIAAPTLVTAAEGDPIAAGAPKLYAAIPTERKKLVHFTAAEGAGGHCEGLARTLYHQRVFDWLDETLTLAG
jgi:pimeloyl-ACP methyl ester carboxylesterase